MLDLVINDININIDDLESAYISSKCTRWTKSETKIITNLDHIQHSSISAFNMKLVDPSNISEVYMIGDFLQIENWNTIIISWIKPCFEPYPTVEGLVLPSFMHMEKPDIWKNEENENDRIRKINDKAENRLAKYGSLLEEILKSELINWIIWMFEIYPIIFYSGYQFLVWKTLVKLNSLSTIKLFHQKGLLLEDKINTCRNFGNIYPTTCVSMWFKGKRIDWQTRFDWFDSDSISASLSLPCSKITTSYYNIIHIAAYYGRLDIIKYARQYNCSWEIDSAISYNDWVHTYFENLENETNENGEVYLTCQIASSRNNLEIMRYAIENHCPCDPFALIRACNNNYLEILKLINPKEFQFIPILLHQSAYYESIDCLTYLLENGCKSSSSEIISPSIVCIEKLKSYGYSIDYFESACLCIENSKDHSNFGYCLDNCKNKDDVFDKILRKTIEYNNFECLKTLHKKCKYRSFSSDAISNISKINPDILLYLCKNGVILEEEDLDTWICDDRSKDQYFLTEYAKLIDNKIIQALMVKLAVYNCNYYGFKVLIDADFEYINITKKRKIE